MFSDAVQQANYNCIDKEIMAQNSGRTSRIVHSRTNQTTFSATDDLKRETVEVLDAVLSEPKGKAL